MKNLLGLFLTLMASSAFSAIPCNGNLEAEFIAEYNHIDLSYAEAGNVEHTTFDLKNFRFFNENQTCPLSLEMAEQATLTENRILNGIESGMQISGILVYDPRTKQYFIDR